MITEPIFVGMSSNEKGSGRDLALMKEINRHPERWDFSFFAADDELDLRFKLGDREIRWELKEKDLLQSSESGHLYMQRMKAASHGHPACIAVLGTNMAVLECIPKVTKQSGWLNPKERAAYEAAIERWESACFASAFPVHYFSGGLDNSMRRICRWSRDYLMENTELPRPKADSWQEYALCGLPGVGPERARGIRDKGMYVTLKKKRITPMTESFPSVALECPVLPEDLMEVEKVGPKTAAKILEAVR